MKNLGLNEIREKYLQFFASKEHLRLESFSLVPENDPSLLLIPAGMAPLKPYFTGELTPPAPRITTCQKCIRTNDIENVGITARHCTFFEMLGNFSFGDYFKPEATKWAWEFVTKVLEMPTDRLYVSIFEEDDEAFDIWTHGVGVDPAHVFRMGRKDNFWEIGTGSGPCGPCSEIYFDRGEKYGCGPDCHPGCDCDRYIEFWNLVFTQFNNDGAGKYTELEKKNIDTGMGLERIACIMQEVDSLFQVDTIAAITNRVSAISGVAVGAARGTDISLRIITDHIRASVMLICDGVIPSNEGRGYILRRLIRRAARHGRLLGITGNFLIDLADTVFQVSGSAYPQIVEKAEYIRQVIKLEEERFAKTIDSGLVRLSDLIAALKKDGKTELPGDDAFRLYDTFGFPVDLTLEILGEEGLTLDRAEFDLQMEAQRERARNAREKQGGLGWAGGSISLAGIDETLFTGYEYLEDTAKILAIITEDGLSGGLTSGMTGTLVLDRTPFYAESGGQIYDLGEITAGEGRFAVRNVQKTPDHKVLHTGELLSGELAVGDTARCSVDVTRRRGIMRAHSSAHLLQAALREVLGAHVVQAGSLVEPDRARFDFSHLAAMTDEEIKRAERMVNDIILEGIPGQVREMPTDEAKKLGAMALFGEKYGDTVRVVSFGDFSLELCGGTHLDNTAKIGLFKITSEASVAAGVRRIEAVTGNGVLALIEARDATIHDAAVALKSTPYDLTRRAAQVTEELRAQSREIEALNTRIANSMAKNLIDSAMDVGGVKLVVKTIDDMTLAQVRALCDSLRGMESAVAVVFALVTDGKITFVAGCGPSAVAYGAHAGNLVKAAAAMTGGGGGGRPDSASAGGRDLAKLPVAMAEVEANLRGMLK